MKIIYKPNGRAAEYSEYAINIVTGCWNGCKYCYAPAVLRKDRAEFHGITVMKENLYQKLEADLVKMKADGIKEPVLFCFTSDAYQNKEVASITHKCLKMFNEHDQNFQILTKNGSLALKDFDLYKTGDAYATTLTFDDHDRTRKIEPHADLPGARIMALRFAHDAGIRTWVSFEPALDQHAIVNLFQLTYKYVDLYKIGKVSNYHSNIKDWKSFGRKMEELCKMYGKKYLIKADLRKEMDK